MDLYKSALKLSNPKTFQPRLVQAHQALFVSLLSVARWHYDGKCIELGRRCVEKIDLGFTSWCIQHEKDYCCYQSKLGRIIQEKGWSQVRKYYNDNRLQPEKGYPLSNGTSSSCRGFTKEEFQVLNFNELDLSEFTNELGGNTQLNTAGNKLKEQQKESIPSSDQRFDGQNNLPY